MTPGLELFNTLVVNDYRHPSATGNGRRWVSVHDDHEGGKIIGVWKGNRSLVSIYLHKAEAHALASELRRK